ncbi:PLU-1-like protein-domain-containing protein [Catenaria anguillulae PL171]|uniref:[histone H3]-trimethyl-L-lysine(4) demethylase n=1 Tax=Catenaria anguillulae PL171 TaxID=765915 RepID=A0A1Y2HGM7_9FUNG|nr:PLU-1-like protein-domain-containing protein [Catenaria anguillulae PL171]
MYKRKSGTASRMASAAAGSAPSASAAAQPTPPVSRLARPARVPALDLSAVNNDFVSMPSSTFIHQGVSHCPIYYPTLDEFSDPLAYIASIRPEAERAGICKIVPPREWAPEFAIDTETFRFKTRIQPLSEMEGSARAALDFLDTLQKLHALLGHPMTHLPTLQKLPVDLYQLRHHVRTRGGFQAVTDAKKWSEVARALGYAMNNAISGHVKACYAKYVLPLDEYMADELGTGGAGGTSALGGPAAEAMAAKDEHVSFTRRAVREARARTSSVEERILQIQSVVLPPEAARLGTVAQEGDASGAAAGDASSAPDGGEVTASDTTSSSTSAAAPASPVRRSTRAAAVPPTPKSPTTTAAPAALPYKIPPEAALAKVPLPPNYNPHTCGGADDHLCEACGHGHNPQLMVVCDDCGRGFHAFCLQPHPLAVHPRSLSTWYCPECVKASAKGEFGFEEGQEYTLHAFAQKANEFKYVWFAERGKIGSADQFGVHEGYKKMYVAEKDVEQEFWRIVEAPAGVREEVEVEYGADLHSSVHGSGFPTVEREPFNPYATNPFNLNVLPTLPGSLLRHVHKDISGCMVPWLYIGMAFATFCWHVEDHNMYSVNYQHWGDTKTWYGVPASDADKLEDVMRASAPDLFAKNPDLMFHITTMVSPGKLVEQGVKVVGCHQRAGEFVITFPRAYHGGFNQGFNCNEAVNFAPQDWVPWGKAAIDRYRAFRKPPVFAHEDVIMNVALQEGHVLETAAWIEPHVKVLGDECARQWEAIRGKVDSGEWRCEYLQDPQAPCEAQCATCHAFCWYAAVRCAGGCGVVSCVEHADAPAACTCPAGTSAAALAPGGVAADQDEDELAMLVVARANKLKVITLRYDIQVLLRAINTVEDVAKMPLRWVHRLQALMTEHAKRGTRPTVQQMSELLAAADKIVPTPPDEAVTLRVHLAKCIEWIDTAAKFIKRRTTKKSAQAGVPKKSLEEAQALLNEAAALFLDAPEVAQLEELLGSVAQLTRLGESILSRGPLGQVTAEECDEYMQACSRLDLHLPQLQLVAQLRKEVDWRQRANHPQACNDFASVMQLIEEARGLGVSVAEDELVNELQDKAELGEQWNQRALQVLGVNPVDLDELDDLVKTSQGIPVSAPYRARAIDLHTRIHKWTDTASKLMQVFSLRGRPLPAGTTRPTTEDLRIVVNQVTELPIVPPPYYEQLTEELRRVDAWNLKCKKLFVRPNTPKSLEIVLTEAYIHIQPTCDVESDVYVEMDDPARRLFCFCRTPDNGYMLGCEVCGEFYHCPCIKLSKREAKKLMYVCPVCDLSQAVPRRTVITPPVEMVEEVVREAYQLPFRPPEISTLELIYNSVNGLRTAVQQFLAKNMFHRSDVPVIKFYLRKVEGCDVIIPEVSQLRDLVERYAKYVPSNEVYCLCQKPTTPLLSMVACDSCEDWFHFPCVKVAAKDMRNATGYLCPLCCYKQSEPYPFGTVEVNETYPPFRDMVQAAKDAAIAGTKMSQRKRKRMAETLGVDTNELPNPDDIPTSITVGPAPAGAAAPNGGADSKSSMQGAAPHSGATTLSEMLLGTPSASQQPRTVSPIPPPQAPGSIAAALSHPMIPLPTVIPPPQQPGATADEDGTAAPPPKKRQRKKKVADDEGAKDEGEAADLMSPSASTQDLSGADNADAGSQAAKPKGVRKKPAPKLNPDGTPKTPKTPAPRKRKSAASGTASAAAGAGAAGDSSGLGPDVPMDPAVAAALAAMGPMLAGADQGLIGATVGDVSAAKSKAAPRKRKSAASGASATASPSMSQPDPAGAPTTAAVADGSTAPNPFAPQAGMPSPFHPGMMQNPFMGPFFAAAFAAGLQQPPMFPPPGSQPGASSSQGTDGASSAATGAGSQGDNSGSQPPPPPPGAPHGFPGMWPPMPPPGAFGAPFMPPFGGPFGAAPPHMFPPPHMMGMPGMPGMSTGATPSGTAGNSRVASPVPRPIAPPAANTSRPASPSGATAAAARPTAKAASANPEATPSSSAAAPAPSSDA